LGDGESTVCCDVMDDTIEGTDSGR